MGLLSPSLSTLDSFEKDLSLTSFGPQVKTPVSLSVEQVFFFNF